jgi:excinuclease UvrABC nuclease subunit
LIDGGPAQLNIAKNIFEKNKKFNKTKIGSMAKGKQNLFIENTSTYIPFKELSDETRLFLISLQDEAHRFAISYHHLVYKKRNLEGKIY